MSISFLQYVLVATVGTTTEGDGMLQPHQVAVDKQELRRLHRLTGAMLGGVAPAGGSAVVTEAVPYAVPDVGREELECPVCLRRFKTNYRLRRHMDIHKGSGYPCSSCHKSLSSNKMLRQHEAACKQGRKHTCASCNREYSSLQILKTHERVQHGAAQPQPGQSFLCPYCGKAYKVKKSMREHMGVCAQNPSRKGPYYCRVEGCPKARHAFSRVKNLNSHMAGAHGWKERRE